MWKKVNGNVVVAVHRLNWFIISFFLKINQVETGFIQYAKIVEIKRKNLNKLVWKENNMGEIYKISNDINDKIYIGKTTRTT